MKMAKLYQFLNKINKIPENIFYNRRIYMYVWSGRAQYQIWFMTNYFKGAFEKNVYFIKFKIIAVFELRTKPDMI